MRLIAILVVLTLFLPHTINIYPAFTYDYELLAAPYKQKVLKPKKSVKPKQKSKKPVLKKSAKPKRKQNSKLYLNKPKQNAGINNAKHRKQGRNNPYKIRTKVYTWTTTKEHKFVRVYTEGKSKRDRSWMMSVKDFNRFKHNPKLMRNLFALPHTPTHYTTVTVPSGTKISMGIAGKQRFNNKNLSGGGIQYELRYKLPIGNFSKGKPLRK